MTVIRRHGRTVAGAAAFALFVAAPVLVLIGSLRPVGPPEPIPLVAPTSMTLDNYRAVLAMDQLMRYGLNSILVAALAVPFSVLVASAAGFGVSRLAPGPRRGLLVATFVAGAIPLAALVVGRLALYRFAGLTDSLLPLVAVGLIGGTPFNVLICYWAFARIPAELTDAALLEGADSVGLWHHVGLPLTRPVTVAVAVVTFALVWGSAFEPLVYLSGEDLYTVPLAIRSLAELDIAHLPVMLAGAVLVTIAPIAVFLLARRGLLAGDTTGVID